MERRETMIQICTLDKGTLIVLAVMLQVDVTSDSRVTTDVRLNYISLVSFIFNGDFPVFNLLLINDAQV